MNQTEIENFWAEAQVRGGLNPIRGVTGPSVDESVPPPAWAFGADPEEATRLVERVLAGEKIATTSLASEYEAEGAQLPTVGDLSIILDGTGHPRALIRTTHVDTVPFGSVGEDHAFREGEESLEEWRQVHREFFGAGQSAAGDTGGADRSAVGADVADGGGRGTDGEDRAAGDTVGADGGGRDTNSGASSGVGEGPVGAALTDETMVVLERFEVLTPPEARRRAEKRLRGRN